MSEINKTKNLAEQSEQPSDLKKTSSYGTLGLTGDKATSTDYGIVRLSVEADDVDDPVVYGTNDPEVPKFRGVMTRSAISGLTDSLAGQTLRVSDELRGLWNYNGARWVPENGWEVDVMDFCDPTASDNTTGLQAAIDALTAQGGGTLVFPAGHTFQFASQISLANKGNIIIQGTNTNRRETSTVNLKFTGNGSDAAINLKSCYGVCIRNMHIQYNNADYTGYLLQTGHDPEPGGGDGFRIFIQGCVISGTETAKNAAGLLDLSKSIIGTVDNNHFLYAYRGIVGRKVAADYAYVYTISNNDFNYIEDYDIWNYDQWDVSANTHEPNLDGETLAMSSDGVGFTRGMRVGGAMYAGDSGACDRPVFEFKRCLGLVFESTWGTIYDQDFAYFENCQGVVIQGLRLEDNSGVGRGIVLSPTGYNYCVTIQSNSLSVGASQADCIVGGAIGLTKINNERGGALLNNEITWGLRVVGSTGTDLVSTSGLAITLGIVRTATPDVGDGAGIRLSDGTVDGVLPGALIIQPGNSVIPTEVAMWAGDGSGLIATFSSVGSLSRRPIGYKAGIGTGGAGTQPASKSKPVTIDKICGDITTNNASLSDNTTATFTVSNSLALEEDTVTVNHKSGGTLGGYLVWAHSMSAGSFKISIRNVSGGALAESLVLKFAINRAANN